MPVYIQAISGQWERLGEKRSYDYQMVAEVMVLKSETEEFSLTESETRREIDPESDGAGWKREDYSVRLCYYNDICERLHANPAVDAFADGFNKRCERFWGSGSWEAVDAFVMDWSVDELWLNPPFSKFEAVLRKIEVDRAHCFMVFPVWPQKEFFRTAMNMSLRHIEYPDGLNFFELYGRDVGPTRWPIIAAYICGCCWMPWQLVSQAGPVQTEMSKSKHRRMRKKALRGAGFLSG